MVSHRKTAKPVTPDSPPDPEPFPSYQNSQFASSISFIQLCTDENIRLPTSLSALQARIRDENVAIDCTHFPRAVLKENVAALLWLEAHVSSPSALQSLSPALWAHLWSLYNIPPSFLSDASNYIRLARWTDPNFRVTRSLSGASTAAASISRHASTPNAARPILIRGQDSSVLQPDRTSNPARSSAACQFSVNTRRPSDSDNIHETEDADSILTVNDSVSQHSHRSTHHHHSHHSSESFRHQIATELSQHTAVFNAIDLTRLLSDTLKLAKISACAKKDSRDSSNNEESPEFSILAIFNLSMDSNTNLLKRGILLSQASYLPSSCSDSALTTVNLDCLRDKLFLAFEKSRSSWSQNIEIGGSVLTLFRDFIITRYQSRLETAQRDYSTCPILLSNCDRQFHELTDYAFGKKNFFNLIDLHITKISRTSPTSADFLIFNRSHLEVLYPSIRAYVLLKPYTSYKAIMTEIDELMTDSTHQTPSSPLPPSSKRMRITPTSPTGFSTRSSFVSKLLPPTTSWMGLPIDKEVVGEDLGIVDFPAFPCRICAGKHRAINCPLQYFLKYNEPCPGFNKDGSRISSAWTGNKLNSPTRLLWKSYIDRHGLIRSKAMTEDVKF